MTPKKEVTKKEVTKKEVTKKEVTKKVVTKKVVTKKVVTKKVVVKKLTKKVMKSRPFIVVKSFLIRYVLKYIRTRRCMVCFETDRAVYSYCKCTFYMCSPCFQKVINECPQCPQCRCDHECVNYDKSVSLINERYELNRMLCNLWDKPHTSHISLNIHVMRQKNEENFAKCKDIIDIVKKTKEIIRQRQLEEDQEEEEVNDIFSMFFGGGRV